MALAMQAQTPVASGSTLVRLLMRYLRPYVALITAALVLQLVQTIASLYLPTLNADIIDKGVAAGDSGYIVQTGIVMLGITLIQILCAVAAVYFGARMAMAVGRDLRSGVFNRVLTFSGQEVGRFGAPSLITRSTNDVQQVQQLTLMISTLFVAAPITGIGGIIMALRLDVPLSGVLLVSVPLLVALVGVVIARMAPLFRTMQLRIDSVNRVLREQITGIRVIRAFVREDYEASRFAVTNTDLADVSMATGKLMALMFPLVMLVVNASSVAVLWFGAQRIDSGGMQIGALLAFLSYLMQILMAVMMATFMFVMIPRAEVSAERIQEVLDTESSLTPSEHPVTSLPAHSELRFTDVAFQYPGAEEPVLGNINFVARAGETIGIIGSTGSGKTTLLNLVPRLFETTAGTVSLDGIDVRNIESRTLSRRVGFVPQKPYLFSGTVASNLRYGNPDASDDDLWHALEIAQARDFVENMPGGLQAPISQGGTNVSGGQRQRLTIARALVLKPDVFLFDDSFSALDYTTDAALRGALARETSGTTVVIVAQRVSTVREADSIVVLDRGQVVGIGTHEALMEDNEIYREIVLSQLTAEEAA